MRMLPFILITQISLNYVTLSQWMETSLKKEEIQAHISLHISFRFTVFLHSKNVFLLPDLFFCSTIVNTLGLVFVVNQKGKATYAFSTDQDKHG